MKKPLFLSRLSLLWTLAFITLALPSCKKGETYAEVLFYKEGFTYDGVDNDFVYNVTLVTDAAKNKYFEIYKAAIQ